MFGREMKADLQINQMLSSYSLPNDQEMLTVSLKWWISGHKSFYYK
jgi:hypothetical protein